MRTVGLIVEYNPLHNGHVYHYEQSRLAADADAVVAVMSGHFLQRGEPAIMNKWARAECALHMGADIVIELPVRYAISAAEWFAYGAVSLLNATGIVDAVCFGSELGDIAPLRDAARELSDESRAFRSLLRSELKKGLPYPAAYHNAAQGVVPSAEPNNTLGLHYLIALQRLGSAIEPLTVRRVAAGYHEPRIGTGDGQIASATAIRRAVFEAGGDMTAAQRYMPAYTVAALLREQRLGRAPLQWEAFATPLLHMLTGTPAARLAELEEVDEGLEHRLAKTIAAMKDEPFSVRQLLAELKTRRYTYAKLQRMLVRILLQHPKTTCTAEAMNGGPGYIRVVGFYRKGRSLLKLMKAKATWPVIAKVKRAHAELLGDDIRATSVYTLGYKSPLVRDALRDYYEPPVQLP